VEPSTPIDPRIDTSKITEQKLPALPNPVAQPLRVVQRVAVDASAVPMSPERFAEAKKAIDRGLAYLRSSQRASGAWMEKEKVQPTDQPRAASAAIAVTAMGAKAFLQSKPEDEAARRALAFVTERVRVGGYDAIAETGVGTYVASAVLSALAASDDRGYTDEIRTVLAWLKTTQWDQSEGLRPTQDWFGGAGYGRNKRPDLSNTQLMLDALHDAGVSPDDPTVQKALAFVSRTQNLPATNDAAWARAEGAPADGGFIYTPANGGESFASEVAGEGRFGEKLPEGRRSLRSYGSMTYAGFKSLLYAGLSRDDVRVRAAYDWIRRNYTFDENPGMGQQGLYYYYHAMARALLAAQQPVITSLAADGATKDRNWRDDLVAAIVQRQREDGSWVNSAERWEEGQPDLVTIYSVLALQEALKPVLQVE
jgi:squalene-hopene/tetraprenyl-beta-curcumene cyclase